MIQTTMAGAWQAAEAAARAKAILNAEHRLDMLNTLRAAAHTLGYSGPVRDSLFAFLGQVFERTNDGFGPPWWPEKSDKSILGWPGGPSCKRSKLFEIIADVRDAGILGVVPFQGDPNRSAYCIVWGVVYDICGKPRPHYLEETAVALQGVQPMDSVHAVDSPVHAVDSSVHAVDKLVHAVDLNNPPCDTHTPAPAGAGARARFDLILDDDEENSIIIKVNQTDPVWDRLEAAADRLALALYCHHKICPSLSRRGRVFLASAALLGEVVSEEWLFDAIEGVQEFKADNPGAYLRTCLRNGMASHVPGGSAEVCDNAINRVRAVVSRWVAKHDWRPDVVVAKERAVQSKPTPAKPAADKALSEMTACEREALRQEALLEKATFGSMSERLRQNIRKPSLVTK